MKINDKLSYISVPNPEYIKGYYGGYGEKKESLAGCTILLLTLALCKFSYLI